MSIVYNFPALTIVFAMLSGILSSAFKKDGARRLNLAVMTVINLMSLAALIFCLRTGESYNYTMGQIPSPWGNEIRFGTIETMLALFVGVMEELILIGGMTHIRMEVEDTKQNLYFLMASLQIGRASCRERV